MPAPLVVHVGLPAARASQLAGATPGARHLVGGDTARADVIVLHGRAGRRAARLRCSPALVVRRPDPADRPGPADRRALAWTDLVVVHADHEARAWTTALARPGRGVEVAADDTPAAWAPVLERALAPTGTVAERWLGDDLLVAPAEPTGSVERLSGTGPAIWRLLATGRTPDEVAAELAADDPGARDAIEAFAAHLADRGIGGPS